MKKALSAILGSSVLISLGAIYLNARMSTRGSMSTVVSPQAPLYTCFDDTDDGTSYRHCHYEKMPLYNQLRYIGPDHSGDSPPSVPYDSHRCGEAFCGATTLAIFFDTLLNYDVDLVPYSDIKRFYPKSKLHIYNLKKISYFGEKLSTGCRYFEPGTEVRLREGGTKISEMENFISSYIDQNFSDYTYFYRYGYLNKLDGHYIKDRFEENKLLFVWRGSYEITCRFPSSYRLPILERAVEEPDDLLDYCEPEMKRVGGHYLAVQAVMTDKSNSKNIVIKFHDPYPDSNDSSSGVTRLRELNGLASVISRYTGLDSLKTQIFLLGIPEEMTNHPKGDGQAISVSNENLSFVSRVGQGPFTTETTIEGGEKVFKLKFQLIDGLFGAQPK